MNTLEALHNSNFFAISFASQNLLSFMIGIVFAATRSYFKQRSGLYTVVAYLAIVAVYYAVFAVSPFWQQRVAARKPDLTNYYESVQPNVAKSKAFDTEYESLRGVRK